MSAITNSGDQERSRKTSIMGGCPALFCSGGSRPRMERLEARDRKGLQAGCDGNYGQELREACIITQQRAMFISVRKPETWFLVGSGIEGL